MDAMLENSIVWIYGIAGTGKSSIAGSFTEMIKNKEDTRLADITLALSFHCYRAHREEDVTRLIPRFAYDLALRFPAFGEKLATDPNLSAAGGIMDQFKNLIHSPLTLLKKEGQIPEAKIVLIMDALDEWGQENDRILLVKNLQKLCREHIWIRIIITSRPNLELKNLFKNEEDGLLKKIDLNADEKTGDDIIVFIQDFMSNRPQVVLEQIDISILLPYINSLFILADVTCKFIAQNPSNNIRILKNEISGSKSGQDSFEVLRGMYELVLKESLRDPENDLSTYLKVIGTIFVLQQPLTINALKSLISCDVQRVIDSLSAVFYKDSGGQIRYHLSFRDFMTQGGKGQTYYQYQIDLEERNEQLVFACLDVMEKQLKFNICHLETSYIINKDVQNPEMNERVRKWISEELIYCCKSWIYHLCTVKAEKTEVWQKAAKFLQNQRMIYWMECMSCMSEVSFMKENIGHLGNTTKVCTVQY